MTKGKITNYELQGMSAKLLFLILDIHTYLTLHDLHIDINLCLYSILNLTVFQKLLLETEQGNAQNKKSFV